MNATILTIGDELLIGQIVDTNSVFIARQLNAAGVVVCERTSIGDDHAQIVAALERALDRSQIVILTGGLGPTKDDITKRTLAKIFRSEMRYDDEVGAHVERMLAQRGIAFNALNRAQAMVPECCTVLFNAHGTAPGMWFERDGKVAVALPGVPFEMEHLMLDEVMPRLKSRFALRQIVHRTLITSGLAESMLAERIEDWEAALPPYLKLAYLPNPGAVRLRLSAYEVDGASAAEEIGRQFEVLRRLIPEHVVGFETASVQELVHDRLTERGLTLAVAESCTGGTIAARFTALPGASAYFRCGVVAYSNEAKHDLLGVDPQAIERHGAVSEEVARQMAQGVRRAARADYAVATTGIAGPTGGSERKPVGTVWIAVATPAGTTAVCRQCGTDRRQIIDRAAAVAISLLRDALREE
ncbi:competence/damage-inducible protein A [Alistipes sp.]|uniref:competence/damage-inducible protein A n=1 Tax=Alistipes sp. TaxID=1872444 RepID=UPI000E8CBBDC|nr:competence/damage-inducible protein A [Alistipes sp.]HBX90616.1 competence/damage-inducible protein A [Alistipes sp.]HCN13946.1 competence/damage-inducible protein A [Alistipes sp.]